MDDDDNLHRLEGSNDQKGGLIVKKKTPTFKIPQPSLLGLDKLALAKRKEKEENARKMSFSISEEDSTEDSGSHSVKQSQQSRKFRQSNPETPTYTGGITEEARKRLLERMNSKRNKEKGVYASTKDLKHEKYDNDKRKRSYYNKEHGSRNSESTHSEARTPRFKDEPKTPNIKIKDETSKTSWDDDDVIPAKKSSWDFPTPTLHKSGGDWSERSTKTRQDDDYSSRKTDRKDKHRDHKNYIDNTPIGTPAHKYNVWAKDRKKTGATPGHFKEEGHVKWDSTVDRQLWEEEQRRIDREWYNMDEGNTLFIIVITIIFNECVLLRL